MAAYTSFAEEHARFSSPVIFKMRFYTPDKDSNITQSKNAAHIGYIGTRPGTDLGETESYKEGLDWDKELEREFPHSADPGTAAGHVKYADERPGSHGLFSYSDEKPDLKEIQNELLEHRGIVWRMVLSLKEEDAQRLGYLDRSKWEDTIRAAIPDAAAKMRIKETNLKWVGAFHQEKGHPHVHIVMWEKNPVIRRGVVHEKLLEDIKRTFCREMFAEERMLLNQEKTSMRELMRNLSKDELGDVVQIMREVRELQKDVNLELNSIGIPQSSIPPKLYSDRQEEIATRIQQISDLLPDRGRIAFKFMPDNVKKEISETSSYILNSPSFHEAMSRYNSAVEKMVRQYSTKEEDIQKAKANAYQDLENRVSQIVLQAAVESKKNVYLHVVPERAREVIEHFSNAMGRPNDNFAERVIANSFRSLRDLGINLDKQMHILSKWSEKADLQLPIQQLRTIVYEVNHEPPSYRHDKEATIAARVLLQSGTMTKKDLMDFLNHQNYSREESAKIIRQAEKGIAESPYLVISEEQWKNLTRTLGVKADYPWEQKTEQIAIQDMKNKVISTFRNAVHDGQNAGYTAFCMTVALKQLQVEPAFIRDVMHDFANRNGIAGIERILNKVEQAETSFLRKDTWVQINEKLQTNLEYPWVNQRVMKLDEEKLSRAIKVFIESTPAVSSVEEMNVVANQYAAVLRNTMDSEKSVKQAVIELFSRSKELPKEYLNHLEINEKRTGDLASLSKLTGDQDYVKKTISDFTKVLLAAGLPLHDVQNMILDWNERSGLNKDPKYIEKLTQSVEKQFKEQATWGRPPVLNKTEFRNLNDTLHTNAPYMWASDKEIRGRSQYKEPSLNIANKLWKSFWNSLEEERLRNHASGELLKRQNQKRMERIAERERD